VIADLKPYAEYKESDAPWFGDVPVHWDVKRLGSVFGERGETNEKYEVTEVLSVLKDIGVIPYSEKGRIGNKKSEDIGRYKIVCPDDLVVNCMNVIIGSVGRSRYTGCLSPVYYVLKRRKLENLPRYLELVFQHKSFQRSLVRIGNGILAHRMRIPMEKLKAELIPLPPPDEQAAIVRFLDWVTGKLERAIRAKRKVIALLGEQKQAIIHHAVTRGLPAQASAQAGLDPSVPLSACGHAQAGLKPSGIPWLGDIPQHWEAPRVKQCARKISKGTTPSTEGREILESGPVRFLKAENISAGRITDKPLCFIDEGTNRMIRRSQLAENDILFVIAGATLGKTAVVSLEVLPANTNQAVAFIRPNSRVVPSFLELWLQSPRIKELIWLNAVQSAQPNLSMADLGNFATPVPPCNEQEQILEFVKSATKPMSEASSRLEREIELLREYRTRLVADVVTGKLDVREAAARLPDEAAPDTAEDAAELSDDPETADEEAGP